jgi:cyanobactin maturation PatA/PatG family protease
MELEKPQENIIMVREDDSLSNEVPEEAGSISAQSSELSGEDGGSLLVYAFGRIGHGFVSGSRRDSIKHQMGESKDPEDSRDILEYLESNPFEAASIQWTLNLDGTTIYVIEPSGPFAREAYDLLRQFLREQTTEGVERVSVPGYIVGTTDFGSEGEIPVIAPEIRGMCNWTTKALVSAVCGKPAKKGEDSSAYEAKRAGVNNFLERVYYEMRNLGREPGERALNFAATNAFQVERVYESALREEMELESIEMEPSPLSRPGADCWDVKLVFFYPLREARTARKLFRFTVDVADVVPVVVGPMRSWSTP